MRKSSLRLYAPFIGLALAQALFISLLPSKAPGKSSVASGGLVSAGPAADAGGAGAVAGDATGAAAGAGPGSSIAQKGLSAAAAKTATEFLNGGDVTKVEGDKSHCKGDRQTGLVYSSPPCVAKWPAGGNNGGKTFQGVDDKTIKVVIFSLAPNDQVNTILATQGLAESKTTRDDMDESARLFINKHYEFYGRQVQIVHFDAPNCPTTPPNPSTCQPDAQKVIDMHPAMIIMESGLYSTIFDQFARAGIPTIGGNWFEDSYFTTRRPYRYDIVMDGTQSAKVIAEYYCKKMAGKNADHSGKTIHPTIGNRDQVKRKLGIVTPDDPANKLAAQVVVKLVSQCDPGYTIPVFYYASDINRAQEQTTSTTAGLIQAKVTSVVCMCDPIAPVFGTNGFTDQQYFPEILGSGEGFTDYDLVGRLYDKSQMAHAFGPSQLTDPGPIGKSEAAIVAHDRGDSAHAGDPCLSCNLNWAYINVLGQMIQQAGPNLNPLSLERGMITQHYSRGGWEATGHRADITLEEFGPNDYTGGSDFREVYWSESAVSSVDGKPGAYKSVDGGRRYRLGELGNSLGAIPVSQA